MRLSRALAGILLALLTMVLAVAPVSATTMVRHGLESLTAENSEIVHGRVLDIHSYWNADHSFIFTDVRIRSLQTLKGGSAGEVTFTLPGGTVGETTILIVGGPELDPGSEYLLFLSREDLPAGMKALTVRDLSQGSFQIGNVGGVRRAFSQALDHALIPDAAGRSEPPGGKDGFELADILRQIADLVDQN